MNSAKPGGRLELGSVQLRIAVAFVIVSGLVLLLLAVVLPSYLQDQQLAARVGALAGFAYIVVSATYIYFLYSRRISALLRSQKELAKAEERFSKAFDFAPIATCITKLKDGSFVDANRAFQQMMGYTKEEMLGRTTLELGLWADPRQRDELVSILKERRTLIERDVEINTKSGERRSAKLSVELIEVGGEGCLLSMYEDVTELKRSLAKSARLNRLYSTLSAGNQAMVRYKERGRLMSEICRALVECGSFRMAWVGFVEEDTHLVKPAASAGHVEGYLDGVVISVDDVPEGRGMTGTAIREGRHIVCDDFETDPRTMPWRDRALSRGYRSSAAFPLRVGGKWVGTLNIYASEPGFFGEEEVKLLDEMAEDLSYALEAISIEEQRSKAVEALRESEADYELLFSNMSEGFAYHKMVTDEGGKPVDYVFLKANEAFERMTGLKREDIIGRRVTEVLPGIDRDKADWIGKYGKVALDGETIEFESYAETLGRWYSVSAYSPKKGYFATIFTDITERKRMEEERATYSKRLEELVAERTKELEETHERLLAAERLATVGRMATQLAHDLRNPLAAVKTGLYYIKETLPQGVDGKIARTVRLLGDAVAHADRILVQLLDYSKSLELERSRLRLDAVLSDAVKTSPIPANVEVVFKGVPPMYVEGDAFKLIKVFQNVISNSIDAMPEGGKLQISGEASGRHVVVRILDTGRGIPKKDLPKLFEPFFTTKAKGMGLGLTISRRIVEAHGGTMDISSKEGEGTVVVITLPASAPPKEKDPL